MSALLELEEAQSRLLALTSPLGSGTVPTHAALDRYLAAPLIAQRSNPAQDISAMDGFAVAGAGPWRKVGESRAGHPHDGTLGPGKAVAISTGAALPLGADAVLIKEEAAQEGDRLSAIGAAPQPGRWIRRAGQDFADGTALAERGALVTPALIALALAAGCGTISVGRQARIALLDTGDELLPGAARTTPASNGPMLAAMAGTLSPAPLCPPPIADDADALALAFDSCADCDVIVTTGGASVGEHDCLQPALKAWGARTDFWRVAIKPGKPLLVARRGRQIVLGLPGNPVSAFVTGFLFLLPLLRHLAGATRPLPLVEQVALSEPVPAGGARREFLRAAQTARGVATTHMQDSAALHALARADWLLDRPARSRALEPGAPCPAYRIGNGAFA